MRKRKDTFVSVFLYYYKDRDECEHNHNIRCNGYFRELTDIINERHREDNH